jgi:hypothetical protein
VIGFCENNLKKEFAMKKIYVYATAPSLNVLSLSELENTRDRLREIQEIKELCEKHGIPHFTGDNCYGYLVEWKEGDPQIKFNLRDKDIRSLIKKVEEEINERREVTRKIVEHLSEFIEEEAEEEEEWEEEEE